VREVYNVQHAEYDGKLERENRIKRAIHQPENNLAGESFRRNSEDLQAEAP
jgi:hypothetical protein